MARHRYNQIDAALVKRALSMPTSELVDGLASDLMRCATSLPRKKARAYWRRSLKTKRKLALAAVNHGVVT